MKSPKILYYIKMFSVAYELLWSTDVFLHTRADGHQIIIKPGDRCHVASARHKKKFKDGRVRSTYRHGIQVEYGFTAFWGYFSSVRGNSKFIAAEQIDEFVNFPDATVVTKVVKSAEDRDPREDSASEAD